MKTTLRLRAVAAIAVAILVPFIIPEGATIPVQGATSSDWNPQSFWHGAWGKSGVHKGIDIFAPKGRPVVSATYGIVIYQGVLGIGGNVVAALGPRWRIHYYAHLNQSFVHPLSFLGPGSRVGEVGNTGDAAGRPSHLHYAILSVVPLPWQLKFGAQGWKHMFFMDPGTWLIGAQQVAPADLRTSRPIG